MLSWLTPRYGGANKFHENLKHPAQKLHSCILFLISMAQKVDKLVVGAALIISQILCPQNILCERSIPQIGRGRQKSVN